MWHIIRGNNFELKYVSFGIRTFKNCIYVDLYRSSHLSNSPTLIRHSNMAVI